MNGIYAEDSSRMPLGRKGCYQSDFVIKSAGRETRITILANQPIYWEDGRFELVPNELAQEILCFPKFRVKEIIIHDIKSNGLAGKLMRMLDSLENV